MEKTKFEQKAEFLYYFVEDCYERISEGKELTKKEKRQLGINYELSFNCEYQEYFAKEMMSDDLYFIFDEIICSGISL